MGLEARLATFFPEVLGDQGVEAVDLAGMELGEKNEREGVEEVVVDEPAMFTNIWEVEDGEVVEDHHQGAGVGGGGGESAGNEAEANSYLAPLVEEIYPADIGRRGKPAVEV